MKNILIILAFILVGCEPKDKPLIVVNNGDQIIIRTYIGEHTELRYSHNLAIPTGKTTISIPQYKNVTVYEYRYDTITVAIKTD